jgi:hypothetical protein
MIFFYFLKIIFDINTSKRSKKYKPHSILAKKKIEIWSNAGSTAEPNRLLYENLIEKRKCSKKKWFNDIFTMAEKLYLDGWSFILNFLKISSYQHCLDGLKNINYF